MLRIAASIPVAHPPLPGPKTSTPQSPAGVGDADKTPIKARRLWRGENVKEILSRPKRAQASWRPLAC